MLPKTRKFCLYIGDDGERILFLQQVVRSPFRLAHSRAESALSLAGRRGVCALLKARGADSALQKVSAGVLADGGREELLLLREAASL